MGKNKTTNSDGISVENKTQKIEEVKKMPKGAFKHNQKNPK